MTHDERMAKILDRYDLEGMTREQSAVIKVFLEVVETTVDSVLSGASLVHTADNSALIELLDSVYQAGYEKGRDS